MIWFFKSLIVFIFQFNISSAVADGGVSNNNIQDIYLRLPELLNETTMICPEKIWPKYNWSSMSVLLVEKGLQTTVWKASDNSVNYVEEKDTPAIAYQGLYKFLQWNGNIGLSINPAGNPSFLDTEALFGLIIHEGFHRIGQENW
ncbi:hypothetical protein K2X05_11900, partial [bacterium]|nr:hypothetical protein [bacterium]